jgi:hypothetical protein
MPASKGRFANVWQICMFFCQALAKCFPRAADGFANVWQNRAVFAEHRQNAFRSRRTAEKQKKGHGARAMSFAGERMPLTSR